VIETGCLWNSIISRKKPVLKPGSYPALTKHGSITDQAVLEQLSLNSTSGVLRIRDEEEWGGGMSVHEQPGTKVDGIAPHKRRVSK
jgi:hypothetical protein